MKKRIVLCADDYGQEQEISDAILKLIEIDSLSATSCIVTGNDWLSQAALLQPYQHKVDIGWHLNLTEGRAISSAFRDKYGSTLTGLSKLLRAAFTNQLQLSPLVAECRAQLNRFREGMGRDPDFIDGHQHVHQFPVIRNALLAIYRQENLSSYVRLVNPRVLSGGVANILKKKMITATGTQPFGKLLKQGGIRHNRSFSGIYAFSQISHYPMLFKGFLREIEDQGIILCHPGLGKARFLEFSYLKSPQFKLDCERTNTQLIRGRSFNV